MKEQQSSRSDSERLNVRLWALDDDRIHHVYPTFGREHVTDQRDKCWCCPRVEFIETGYAAVIIHEAEQ